MQLDQVQTLKTNSEEALIDISLEDIQSVMIDNVWRDLAHTLGGDINFLTSRSDHFANG